MVLVIYAHLMKKRVTPAQLRDLIAEYFEGEDFIRVMPFGAEEELNNFFHANDYSGYDDAKIYVTGNDDRILVTSIIDNLGKGASGAAIQCMNIRLGLPQETGLKLH